jgi:hypothetical protein
LTVVLWTSVLKQAAMFAFVLPGHQASKAYCCSPKC